MTGQLALLRRRKRLSAAALCGVVALMIGLVSVSVPLYRWFCEVTGYGGTTQRADAATGLVADRIITVRLSADVAPGLPWRFRPEQPKVMEATPSDHLTFLTTATGKPFTAAGFTNWIRDMCNEAGLPKGTPAHGLHKAACRRLAEAGCSANVIAAISGHASLREVQRYTAAADQARMARSAIDTMVAAFPATRTSSGKPR